MTGTLAAWALVAVAAAARLHPGQIPDPRLEDAWVSDVAEAIAADDERALNDRLERLHREVDAQVVVVTADKVGGRVPDFADKLMNHWGVGTASINQGVVIVLTAEPPRAALSVGEGLAETLPGGRRRRLTEAVAADLTAGELGLAATALTASVERAIRAGPEPEGGLAARLLPGRTGGVVALVVAFVALTAGAFGVLELAARRRRRCPSCGVPMARVPSARVEPPAAPGEPHRAVLGAAPHHVFQCARHGAIHVEPGESPWSPRATCTQCGVRAVTLRAQVVEAPAPERAGVLRVESRCGHCGAETTVLQDLPGR